ncbi:MAG: lysophospholipid acyltransferase family protein [Pedococcus sp.]
MFYWVLKTVVLGPILRLLFRPWVEGEENIPEDGAAIFASNHLSFSDSIFLPLVVPRRMTFLAKSDYFTGRGIKGRLTAAFFRGVGQLPVDRSGGGAGEAALRSGLRVLRRGEMLGIYPEGTRSPDGRLYRGRTGVARMALEAGVPVLPVAMIGTDKAQPTGKKIPKLMRIGVKIGKPLDFSRYEGMEDDRFVLRSITDEIMYELMLLSGQEYVDMYATSMKDRILAAAKTKARELQEAALPGSAAKELEEALDAHDDEAIRRARRRVDDATADIDETTELGDDPQDERPHEEQDRGQHQDHSQEPDHNQEPDHGQDESHRRHRREAS